MPVEKRFRSSNGLLRQVRRHANSATLFRTAVETPPPPDPIQRQTAVSVSRALIQPAPTTLPVGHVADGTPTVQLFSERPMPLPTQPAVPFAAVQPLAPPMAAGPAAVVQTADEVEPGWDRLKNILRGHERKQGQEGSSAAGAPAAGDPVQRAIAAAEGSAGAADSQRQSDHGLPLEAAWPVESSAPAPQQRPSAQTGQSRPPKPPASVTTEPLQEQQIRTKLDHVLASRPTDSSIELHLPRRPRPAPPTAGATTQPPVQRAQDRDAEPPAPDMIETEIGPLPADMWELLGQTPPGQSVTEPAADPTASMASPPPTTGSDSATSAGSSGTDAIQRAIAAAEEPVASPAPPVGARPSAPAAEDIPAAKTVTIEADTIIPVPGETSEPVQRSTAATETQPATIEPDTTRAQPAASLPDAEADAGIVTIETSGPLPSSAPDIDQRVQRAIAAAETTPPPSSTTPPVGAQQTAPSRSESPPDHSAKTATAVDPTLPSSSQVDEPVQRTIAAAETPATASPTPTAETEAAALSSDESPPVPGTTTDTGAIIPSATVGIPSATVGDEPLQRAIAAAEAPPAGRAPIEGADSPVPWSDPAAHAGQTAQARPLQSLPFAAPKAIVPAAPETEAVLESTSEPVQRAIAAAESPPVTAEPVTPAIAATPGTPTSPDTPGTTAPSITDPPRQQASAATDAITASPAHADEPVQRAIAAAESPAPSSLPLETQEVTSPGYGRQPQREAAAIEPTTPPAGQADEPLQRAIAAAEAPPVTIEPTTSGAEAARPLVGPAAATATSNTAVDPIPLSAVRSDSDERLQRAIAAAEAPSETAEPATVRTQPEVRPAGQPPVQRQPAPIMPAEPRPLTAAIKPLSPAPDSTGTAEQLQRAIAAAEAPSGMVEPAPRPSVSRPAAGGQYVSGAQRTLAGWPPVAAAAVVSERPSAAAPTRTTPALQRRTETAVPPAPAPTAERIQRAIAAAETPPRNEAEAERGATPAAAVSQTGEKTVQRFIGPTMSPSVTPVSSESYDTMGQDLGLMMDSSPTVATATEEQTGAEAVNWDVDDLARRVYNKLKRRLAIERERERGRI